MAPLDLSTFSPVTRRLVQDGPYRARLTSVLLHADPSSDDAMQARGAVDAAVVEILTAVGLPRGPVNGPIVEHFNRGWFGRKTEDCRLLIDLGMFDILPEAARPDALLQTWVHESLHARHPFSPDYAHEWRETSGYEEGLAEGLTHLIVVDGLGLHPVITNYRFYVAVHQSLAIALQVEVENLWRELWTYPAGKVRLNYVSAVERILREERQAQFTSAQRAQLSLFASRYLATNRARDLPDMDGMVATWRKVIG